MHRIVGVDAALDDVDAMAQMEQQAEDLIASGAADAARHTRDLDAYRLVATNRRKSKQEHILLQTAAIEQKNSDRYIASKAEDSAGTSSLIRLAEHAMPLWWLHSVHGVCVEHRPGKRIRHDHGGEFFPGNTVVVTEDRHYGPCRLCCRPLLVRLSPQPVFGGSMTRRRFSPRFAPLCHAHTPTHEQA